MPPDGRGQPRGFLFFSSQEPETFREVHIDTFLQISGQLATIVEKGRLYDRLIHLNEEKNRVLGVAAHDLRSPLGTISSAIETVLQGLLGDVTERQRRFLGWAHGSALQAAALVNDLLDVTAIEAGRLDLQTEAIDLRPFLEEHAARHGLLAEVKGIRLALAVDPRSPQVILDPERMRQVLSNLLDNAVKFSRPGTTVTLGSRVHEFGMVEIFVTDQGQGIPATERDRLFTDFGRCSVQPTSGEPSTGLGLAIVKRIVDAHGGRILVESEVGVGSTFRIVLPVEPPPPIAP